MDSHWIRGNAGDSVRDRGTGFRLTGRRGENVDLIDGGGVSLAGEVCRGRYVSGVGVSG